MLAWVPAGQPDQRRFHVFLPSNQRLEQAQTHRLGRTPNAAATSSKASSGIGRCFS